MNRGELLDAILGSRFSAARRGDALVWLNGAIDWVWDEAEWKFKRVDELPATVTLNNRLLGLPADYGEGLAVFDERGDELTELSNIEFSRLYLAGKIDGTKGSPEAFTVDNGQIRLGPTPSAGVTYYLSYRRQMFHYESDATTVTAGHMDEENDLPPFHPGSGKHHIILVHHAAMLGLAEENDPSAITFEQMRDNERDSMFNDRMLLRPPARLQYGRVTW